MYVRIHHNDFSIFHYPTRTCELIIFIHKVQQAIKTCYECKEKGPTNSQIELTKFLGQAQFKVVQIYQYPSFWTFYEWKLWYRGLKTYLKQSVRKRPISKGGHNAHKVLSVKHNTFSHSDMLLLFKITLYSIGKKQTQRQMKQN